MQQSEYYNHPEFLKIYNPSCVNKFSFNSVSQSSGLFLEMQIWGIIPSFDTAEIQSIRPYKYWRYEKQVSALKYHVTEHS